jgi:hypothetical protein
VTRVARIVFALVVVATFGAFLVAQRLKHQPSVVQSFHLVHREFSPNADSRFDRLHLNFMIKQSDDVTVDVVDRQGDAIRRLAEDRSLRALHALRLTWDGTDDAHAMAPEGVYRLRVMLRRDGRSIVVPRTFVLDLTPLHPIVTALGPVSGTRPVPELFPNKEGYVTATVRAGGNTRKLLVFKTSPGPVTLVREIDLGDADTGRWDGTAGDGRPVPPGTYLLAVQNRDAAGNVGTSPPLGPDRLPRLPYGSLLRGHGGVTVRHVGVQPPVMPQQTGKVSEFGIDTRRQPYRWSLRRVGGRVRAKGAGTRGVFHVHAPGGASGVYLLEVRTRRQAGIAPFVVQGRRHRRVVVVLPTMTWQGLNPTDDDGDGAPNLLAHGQSANLLRPYAFGDRLPPGFTENEAPLLTFLDRNHLPYDVTTDVALAIDPSAALAGHTGVVLAGDTRWLPASVTSRLRRFVRAGGGLASFGTDSLRRHVTLTPRAQMLDPTPDGPPDAFGARLRPVAKGPVTLTNFQDSLQLFAGDVFGGTGVFPGVASYEATTAVGDAGELASSAVTDDGAAVIVAVRYGRGIVIRTGIPGFATRLGTDQNSAQLVRRTWQLMSR